MKRFDREWMIAGLLIAAVAGCVLEEEPGQLEEALYLDDVVSWAAIGSHVPVCWIDPGWSNEKTVMRTAIEETWIKESGLTVSWQEGCPTTGMQRFVRIHIASQMLGTDGQYANLGADGVAHVGMPRAYRDPDMGSSATFWLRPDHLYDVGRLQYVGVHEFGHILGFNHEQDRPENAGGIHCNDSVDTDWSGTVLGGYDQDSIMNYCNSDGNVHGNLTPIDVMGVRVAYGPPSGPEEVWATGFAPSGETVMPGDFDGDGESDIVTFVHAANNRAVYVRLSDGRRTFGAWGGGKWHDDFCGSNDVCQVGDLDGNGKDDIVSFTRSSGVVKVALSTGNGFGPAQQWHDHFCLGAEVCKLGYFNGDDRADIIAFRRSSVSGVGEGDVWVALSNGVNGFKPAKIWHGYFCVGGEVCEVGDFDGDGRDDIFAFDRVHGRVWVAYAAGWLEFSSGSKIHDSFCLGNETCRVGDLDGDGRADLVAFVKATKTGSGSGDVWMAHNDSAGGFDRTFRHHDYFCVGGESCWLGDVDGDGGDNLIAFDQGNARVWVDDGGRP